jgi:hypothetical protein
MIGKGLVAALAAALIAAPAAQARRPSCLTSGRTLQANGSARLFYVGDAAEYTLYVCWRPTRRVHAIGALELAPNGAMHPKLSGRWVAYDEEYCDHGTGTCSGRVLLYSARTGRRVRAATQQSGLADALVLTTGGIAAWTRDGAVSKLGPGGTEQLDPGPGDGSLALAGTRLYWLRGSVPMSALLG